MTLNAAKSRTVVLFDCPAVAALPDNLARGRDARMGIEVAAQSALDGRTVRIVGAVSPPGIEKSAALLDAPHPILRLNMAEGEEGVVLGDGEDVRDSVPVPDELDRSGRSERRRLAVNLRERAPPPRFAARHHEEARRPIGTHVRDVNAGIM